MRERRERERERESERERLDTDTRIFCAHVHTRSLSQTVTPRAHKAQYDNNLDWVEISFNKTIEISFNKTIISTGSRLVFLFV